MPRNSTRLFFELLFFITFEFMLRRADFYTVLRSKGNSFFFTKISLSIPLRPLSSPPLQLTPIVGNPTASPPSQSNPTFYSSTMPFATYGTPSSYPTTITALTTIDSTIPPPPTFSPSASHVTRSNTSRAPSEGEEIFCRR